MKTTGRVNGIISNIVIVKADGPVGQNEICYVWTGDTKMMAEVIKVIGDAAYVQVFDSTRGLKIGDKVEFEGHMLEATLAPGMLSRNYDGLQNDLEKMDGLFIARGSITDPIDFDAEWEFAPLAKARELFAAKYPGDSTAEELMAFQRYEEELYCKYSEFYGYVFFIARKPNPRRTPCPGATPNPGPTPNSGATPGDGVRSRAADR